MLLPSKMSVSLYVSFFNAHNLKTINQIRFIFFKVVLGALRSSSKIIQMNIVTPH